MLSEETVESKKTLDIVLPVYNEESCINELFRRLLGLIDQATSLEISLIFVNDGSQDNTMKILEGYSQQYPFVKVINFSRNFGHQIALTAGVDHTTADYIAIIDADLQDPPELILEMYEMLVKEKYEIVYGQRSSRSGESIFKKFTAKLFYRLMSKMCDVDIPIDTGDFRLITRKVVNAFGGLREKHRFIRGMIPWLGFKNAPFHYQRDARYAGETKYPFKKMMKFALDGIFSFSNVPIKIATYIGSRIIGLGVLGGLILFYLRFFTDYTVPGITAVIMSILVMGGIQILMLGIIGEYIGRIFEEAKGRPLYIIDEKVNFNKFEKSTNPPES